MEPDVQRIHDDLRKLGASLEARGVGGAVLCIVAAAKLAALSEQLVNQLDRILE